MTRKDMAKINIAVCSIGAAICLLCSIPNFSTGHWFWGGLLIIFFLVDLFFIVGNALALRQLARQPQ